jgi:uncharacterized membrane protein YuzA (DUF378 family)
MSVETFYATAAQVCFTLLGFWWAVVQFRHAEWMRKPGYRRMAHAVSLYFLLPGIMSLVSLLAGGANYLWRVTFAIAGLVGIIATLIVINAVKVEEESIQIPRVVQWITVPLYALITLIALRPEVGQDLGIALQPLELEGILFSAMIFFGINFAWLLFSEPLKEH